MGRHLHQGDIWASLAAEEKTKTHNHSWFDCSSTVPDTTQKEDKEDLDLSLLSKRNFASPHAQLFPYLPLCNLLTSMFSHSGRKWLSEQLFTKVIKWRCARIRLVILYPGDIQQDFLVYQQADFFFLFLFFHSFPDLCFLILLEGPNTDSLQIKRLTYQRHYFLEQHINRV